MTPTTAILLAVDVEMHADPPDLPEPLTKFQIARTMARAEASITLRYFEPDERVVRVYSFTATQGPAPPYLCRVSEMPPSQADLAFVEALRQARPVDVEGLPVDGEVAAETVRCVAVRGEAGWGLRPVERGSVLEIRSEQEAALLRSLLRRRISRDSNAQVAERLLERLGGDG